MFNSTVSLLASTTTSKPPVTLTGKLIGFGCLIIASVFYGGNYLPVKKYETGDGVFFQLVVCIAIWTTGLIVNWVQGFPEFYLSPAIGGFLWSTGNAATVPIIKCIGFGLGSLFWNIIGLIIGWAYVRFGWFGVHEQKPADEMLNYLGVGFSILSAIVFIFVKAETRRIDSQIDETQGLVNSQEENSINYSSINNPQETSFFDRMSINTKRVFGTLLSAFSGIMYAFTYAPIAYIEDNVEGSSKNQNDYAFSQSSGILIGSLFYFIIYSVIMKNEPKLYPEVILPGFLSGWLWGIANTAYFIATNYLSQAISFPIVNIGPVVVAFLIGAFYREFRGKKNLTFLFLGSILGLIGIVFLGLSI